MIILQEIEKHTMKSQELIYVKFEHSTWQELIKNGYNAKTRYLGKGFEQTFKDPLYTIQECRQGAFRTFDGLMQIIHSYYPFTTKYEVSKFLLENYYIFRCRDIKKFVIQNPTEYIGHYSHSTSDVTGTTLNDILRWGATK